MSCNPYHTTRSITGANAGLGKDVARQLALRADVDSIHLACRDQAKAEAAQADLQRITGRPVFEVLIMDTADLASVRAALAAIDRPLRAACSTPGTGGMPMARARSRTTIFSTCSVTRFCWKAYSMRDC